MTIGDKIRYHRKAAGLTQKQLGELSGTSETTIRQYEGGKRQPRIEQLQKIADTLQITVLDLMGLDYKDNELDRNDVFTFYDSLGFQLKLVEQDLYRLTSRDITVRINLLLTWEDLEKIKHESWKYLKYTLMERSEKQT